MAKKSDRGEFQIEDLIQFAMGELSGREKQRVERAISRDQKLSSRYRVVKALLSAGKNTPSDDIIKAARNLGDKIFKDYVARESDQEKEHGVILFDSSDLPLPEGVRPAATDTRRLKYQLPCGVVEFRVYPVSLESFELVGMISECKTPGPFTIVVKSGRRTERHKTDEVSLFLIPRISRGEHVLQFHAQDQLVGTITVYL